MEDKNLLPVLAEQNKQFEEIKAMIDKLAQMPSLIKENPNDNPLYIDYRKIDAFMTLQNAYYNLFAQQKISLEYVPYAIISKSIKWTEKSYKKDLKKQVNKKYKKLIKAEKSERRKIAINKMFTALKAGITKPFKLIFKGIKNLFNKIFKKKQKKSDCTNQSDMQSTADINNTVVENDTPGQI